MPESERKPEQREVVRHKESVLQTFPQFYGFVTRREGPPSGPWHVTAECIQQPWMDRVWAEMGKTGDLAANLLEAVGSAPFESTYEAMDQTARQSCYDAWKWFLGRAASKTDPMETSGLELLITQENGPVVLEDWYLLRLSPEIADETAPTLPYAQAPRCFHTVFKTGDPDAEVTILRQVLDYQRVPDSRGDLISQGALKALHFPHPNPNESPAPPTPSGSGSSGGPVIPVDEFPSGGLVDDDSESSLRPERPEIDPPLPQIPVHRERLRFPLASLPALARSGWRYLLHRMDEFAESFLVPALQPAFAGAPGFQLPVEPVRYIGSPAPADGQPQPENPLTRGLQHPFVAVMDVGQGNCEAIYDGNRRILAYFDIGHPWGHMASSRPALRAPAGPYTLLTPCVCHRPLIILSHWDLDHFKLGLDTAATHGLAWLAPAQVYGPKGTDLVNAITNGGGQLHIWTGAGHMRFPWGFLERCRAPAANLNSSGLAAFVCVQDDPIVERMRQAVDAVAGLIAAPLGNGAPPDIAVVARPVAAALAWHVGGVLPAALARAAVRAAIAARLGGIQATAVAIEAFISRTDGAATNLTAQLNLVNGGLVASLPAVVSLLTLPQPDALLTAQAALGAAGANAAVPAGNAARANAAAAPFGAPVHGIIIRIICHAVAPPAGFLGPAVAVTQGNGPAAARLAIIAIDGMALVGAPANTIHFAKTVAAAIGTTGTGPQLPAGDIENFAVRVVVALLAAGARPNGEIASFVLNGLAVNAANVLNLVNGVNVGLFASLPAPPSVNVALFAVSWTAGARAIIGAGVGNLNAQANAAQLAGMFIAPDEVRAAIEPLLNLRPSPGAPIFSPSERFVLLNADANFDFVPSLQVAGPPVVVAMTAMHHGSLLEDDIFLDDEHIPWAPGSAQAARPAIAVAANNNCSACHCIAETANQLANGAAAGGPLITRIAHAGAAAAAAVLAAAANVHLGAPVLNLLTGDYARNIAQAVACAVMSRRIGAVEAGEVGMAAAIGASQRDRLLPAHEFALAAQLARVRFRAGDTQLQIETQVGAAYPYLEENPIARMAMQLPAAQAPDYGNIDEDTPTLAAVIDIGAHYRALLSELAACAWEGADAGNNVGDEIAAIIAENQAPPGTLANDVSAVMAMEITDAHNNPVDAEEVARNAAELAMIAEAIRATNVNRFQLTSALRSLTANTHAAAGRAVNISAGNGPGPIAYSYGVCAGNFHCYPAPTAGGFGHPHPLAVREYEVRGWTVRRNAPANANHGAPQTNNSPRGHVALAWDYANDRNLVFGNAMGNQAIADPAMLGPNPNGIMDLPACPTCNQRIKLHL